MDIDVDRVIRQLGEPEDHRLPRENQLDLSFAGWCAGNHGIMLNGENTGTKVRVYVTTTGLVVTHVHRWSERGEGGAKSRAAYHETPQEALRWLKDDAGGELGYVSKKAWEQACAAVPTLHGKDVERI